MNGEVTNTVPTRAKVRSPVFKFLVGFVGGLCAATFPRLMATLTLHGNSDVVTFSVGYLGVAVVFAVLIGIVVVIIEWGVPREPGSTFMAALGLPALLAGALNTSNGAYVLDTTSKENQELIEVVKKLSDVPEVSVDDFVPLSEAEDVVKPSRAISLNIIPVAYAQVGTTKQQTLNLNPSLQVKQSQYYIILDHAGSAHEAEQKAKSYKSSVPTAQAVQAGDRFLVIDSAVKQKSEAVLEALRLKEQGFRPQLLRKK